MKISINHLKKLLPENVNNNEISDILNGLGHENEINDNIIDIDVTPNRGDCLSVEGILRDLSNFYSIDFNTPLYEEEIKDFNLPFKNNSNGSCNKISFLKIETVGTVEEYKPYLEDFFSELNNKKINFFTDVSNYICYEMGQPTHCYDFDKLDGEIELKWIDSENNFNTLVGKEIKLKNENLVFSIKDKIINLAGIMGGLETSCTSKTKNVLVECAYFEPQSIIGKSVKYDLNSDAAYKFERGVDFLRQEETLRRFIYIVNDHCKIKNLEVFVDNNNSKKNKEINIDLNKIQKILGIEVSNESCSKILSNLGFQINGSNAVIPSYRHDISSINDLAEEIARVIGYDNIPSEKFEIIENKKNLHIENKIRNYLIKKGFFEIINFPFSNQENDQSIRLDNPLDSNKSYLRTDLKDSLIENLLYNERRQKESIQFFEISNIYDFKGNEINRSRKIALVVSGRMGRTYQKFNKYFDSSFLKEILKPILKKDAPEINEISRNDINTKIKNKIFYAEFNLSDIDFDAIDENNKLLTDFSEIKKVSDFPSTNRDISVTFKKLDELGIISKKILEFTDPILLESFVFDYYPNSEKQIAKIGFRFTFQHESKTLTDDEVGKVFTEIVKLIYSFDDVEIAGIDLESIKK